MFYYHISPIILFIKVYSKCSNVSAKADIDLCQRLNQIKASSGGNKSLVVRTLPTNHIWLSSIKVNLGDVRTHVLQSPRGHIREFRLSKLWEQDKWSYVQVTEAELREFLGTASLTHSGLKQVMDKLALELRSGCFFLRGT